MEVHAHTHTPRKKWTHYFWEFLMLFLAVTLGFFVENQREHFVEHLRAREYAKSLYDDLKVDTFTIGRTYKEKEWILEKYDSALSILASNDLKNNNEFLYYIERYLSINDVFTTQDVTYQQLKNSGSFRYIKNIALYKKITDYYNLYSRYQVVDGDFGGFQNRNELLDLESAMFSPEDLASLDNRNASTFYDIAISTKRKLKSIRGDEQFFKKFYLRIANESYRTAVVGKFLIWLKEKAAEVIMDLKTEYNLK